MFAAFAMLAAAALAAPLQVHVTVPLPGASLQQDWELADAPASGDLVAEDAAILAQPGRWLRGVQPTLDDYGNLRVAAAAIDALGIAVDDGPPAGDLRAALAAQRWTADDRRAAIGGALRAMGYDVLLTRGSGLLALRTTDERLNAAALTRTWSKSPPERWLLWDGVGRVGLPDVSASHETLPDSAPAKGRAFAFLSHELPEFVRRDRSEVRLAIDGTRDHLAFDVPRNAAAWMVYYPEPEFADAVAMGLRDIGEIRGLSALTADDEPATLDRLLRTVQNGLAYRAPSALEPLFTTLDARVADCDGFALLTAVLLEAIGYTPDRLQSVHWPNHIAVAVLPRERGPKNGTSITVDGRAFYLMDATFFRSAGGRFVTQWGDVPDDYEPSVTVTPLR